MLTIKDIRTDEEISANVMKTLLRSTLRDEKIHKALMKGSWEAMKSRLNPLKASSTMRFSTLLLCLFLCSAHLQFSDSYASLTDDSIVSFYKGKKLCFDRLDLRHEDCCHDVYGPHGNPACWDSAFTKSECCYQSQEWERAQPGLHLCRGDASTYCLHLLRLTQAHSNMKFKGCLAEADRGKINGINVVPLEAGFETKDLWLLARFLCHKVSDFLSAAALYVGQSVLMVQGFNISSTEEGTFEEDGSTSRDEQLDFQREVGEPYEAVKRAIQSASSFTSENRASAAGEVGAPKNEAEVDDDLLLRATPLTVTGDGGEILLTPGDVVRSADDLMVLDLPDDPVLFPGLPNLELLQALPRPHRYLQFFEVYGRQHRRTMVAIKEVSAEIASLNTTTGVLVALREKRDELLLSADLQLQQLARFFLSAMHKTSVFMRTLGEKFYKKLAPFLVIGCERDVCNDELLEKNAREIDRFQHVKCLRYDEMMSSSGNEYKEDVATGAAVDEAETRSMSTTAPLPEARVLPEPLVADLVFASKLIVPPSSCRALAASPGVRSFARSLWPPPDFVPGVFRGAYTIRGRVEIHDPPVYFAQKSFEEGWAEKHDWRWRKGQIERDVENLRRGELQKLYTSYGDAELHDAFFGKIAAEAIAGKHVLVLGSEIPWMEAFLIRYGAKTVTTVDYREPDVGQPGEYVQGVETGPHPQLRFLHFEKLGEKFQFARGESLGRYGDQLNPYADVQTTAMVWCVLKFGAYFFAGPNTVDTNQWLTPGARDRLYWNSGRDLGRQQWARLMLPFRFDGERSSRDTDKGYFAWKKEGP
eukprot:g8789.t1